MKKKLIKINEDLEAGRITKIEASKALYSLKQASEIREFNEAFKSVTAGPNIAQPHIFFTQLSHIIYKIYSDYDKKNLTEEQIAENTEFWGWKEEQEKA